MTRSGGPQPSDDPARASAAAGPRADGTRVGDRPAGLADPRAPEGLRDAPPNSSQRGTGAPPTERDPAVPVRRAEPGGLRLRPMRLEDVDDLMPIEVAAYPFPWTRGIFCDCLRVGYDGWIVESEGGVLLGHAMLSYGAGEGHLLNLTVAPAVQGRGIGRWMLRRLMLRAAEQGVRTLFLEVRPSNHSALHLYVSEGFERIGIRPRYYPAHDGREDAWVYARALSPAPRSVPSDG